MNRSFRFFWIINTKATNIEVCLNYLFFSKIHLFTCSKPTPPWFILGFKIWVTQILKPRYGIISFTTESKWVGFSSRFDVTIYFETTWSDANQFMTTTQVVTNALRDSGEKKMMLNSFKSTFRKKRGKNSEGFDQVQGYILNTFRGYENLRVECHPLNQTKMRTLWDSRES